MGGTVEPETGEKSISQLTMHRNNLAAGWSGLKCWINSPDSSCYPNAGA